MSAKTATSDLKALAPEASVFVSANAGAGKTSLLTNRVLSLLLHGVMPSKILCLTFTKAAATEMTGRVLSELGKWVMADDKSLENSLESLLGNKPDKRIITRARSLFASVLEAPEGIRIQTIHAFCQSLLRRFPIEVGISPHFMVMDSRTEQELLQESRLRLLTSSRDGENKLQQSIAYLARNTSESAFHELLSEIIKQKRKFQRLFSSNVIDNIISNIWAEVNIPEGTTLSALMEKHFIYDEKTKKLLSDVADLLAKGDEKEIELSAALLGDKKNIDEYILAFITKTEGTARKTLFKKGTITDDKLIEALKAEQERVVRFYADKKALEVAIHTEHMLRVAAAFLAIYSALKRARASMDYDDLILLASSLLTRSGISPWVLFKLDGGIDHILVDEAQDTSPEQWMIIDALTDEFFAGKGSKEITRSLFVVGDEKQSIFAFQGANVEELGKKQTYFQTRIKDAGMEAHNISLTRSFRSTQEILSAVDVIFAQPNARAGLMFGSGELAHIATRVEQPGLVELWPLLKPDEEDRIAPSTILARHIADTIHGWINNGQMLEAKGRRVEAGDIMILVRSRTSLVDRLVRALKRKNIPVGGIDRMMLGDNLAVQDLIALGQIMLLPEDDLTLAALLKSPIINLSEEQLFALANGREGMSLWERLKQLSFEDEIYADAFNLLADLRSRVDYMAPFELYSYLLDTVGARRKILGRMGDEYAEPIDEFMNQALLYERGHTPSMQGFLHWLATSESEIKRDMEQVKNAVRIMTVHAAKGLQAPIVIIPDTTEPPREQSRILWHDSIPLLPKSAKSDDALCAKVRGKQRESMLEEYRRLLYVALTRAEDCLYICGATGKDKLSEQSWYNLVATGLANIAKPFETPRGEGLRIGNPPSCHPERSEGSLSVYKEQRLSQDDKKFDFLFSSPPAEPIPSKPISPSRMPDKAPSAASPLAAVDVYQRGSLIHSLLQYLPDAEGPKRAAIAENIASSYISLSSEMRADCIAEVLNILANSEYSFLFAAGSLAEVPVAGNVHIGGRTISVAGQIDRLCITENEVWIVDFKSNAIAPASDKDIPRAYLAQLFLYKLLLEAIYPQKSVKCALLWTVNAKLMPIGNALLDEALLSSYIFN